MVEQKRNDFDPDLTYSGFESTPNIKILYMLLKP